MAIGSTLGGYGGARLARKSAPAAVERVVVLVGILLTVLLAWRSL
jgi:uncharacterized membrane protein YfcA